MNQEDRKNHKHILNCDLKRCAQCKIIFLKFYATSMTKANYKFQKTDKFKEYKKKYYEKNRNDILRKYHALKVLKGDLF